MKRLTWGIALAALGLLAAPSDSFAERMRCKSTNYKYNFCRSGQPIVRASVRDRKSDRPCIEGRTWGYQRNGIWVNHGCDADFEIQTWGDSGGGWGGSGGSGGSWGGGGWGGSGGSWEAVPGWAVGTWRSERQINGAYHTVTVYPNGSATWTFRGGRLSGQWRGRDEIQLYNNTTLDFDGEGSRVRIELPRYGRNNFRRVY